MKKILGTILGPRLRAARKAKAMTSIACAKEVGVSQPAWNMWEMGVRLPKIELLTEICDLLQITPNQLLGYDDPLSAPPRETKTEITTGDHSPVVNGIGNIVGNSINVTPPSQHHHQHHRQHQRPGRGRRRNERRKQKQRKRIRPICTHL